MKSIAALALVLLAVSATASETNMFDTISMEFSPQRSILTLLTQVEAQMKMGGPLETIYQLLDNFRSTITDEQVQHDNLYAKQQKECDSEFEFRNKEVSDAVGALKAAQETLDGCTAQHARAVGDFAITKKQLQENRNFYQTIVSTRKREAFEYDQKTKAVQANLDAVEEALVILEELFAGEKSFADLTRHAHTMLKNAATINKATALAPLMQAFVQLAAKSQSGQLEVDEQLLNRLKTILQSLREQFQDAFNELVAQEDAAKEQYEADSQRVQGIINELVDTQNELQTQIGDLDKCMITQTGIVGSATAKRDRNQQLLDDATALCTSTGLEYTQSSKSRKQELKLLNAIKERVDARFQQLPESEQ